MEILQRIIRLFSQKRIAIFSFLLLSFVLGFLFFPSIVGFFLQKGIYYSQNLAFHYKKAMWKNGKIVFQDVTLGGDKHVLAKEIALFLSWNDRGKSSLQVEIFCPEVHLSSRGKSFFILPKVFFIPCHIQIKEGILWQQEKKLFFSYEETASKTQGKLWENTSSFFCFEIEREKDQKKIHGKGECFSLSSLYPLLKLPPSLEPKEGSFCGEVFVTLDQDKVLDLSVTLDVKDSILSTREYSCKIDRFWGQGNYVADKQKPLYTIFDANLWKEASSSFEVSGASLTRGEKTNITCKGNLLFLPKEALVADFLGTIDEGSQSVPFSLELRGYFKSFFSSWLRGQLVLGDSSCDWQWKELSSHEIEETVSLKYFNLANLSPLISVFSSNPICSSLLFQNGYVDASLIRLHTNSESFSAFLENATDTWVSLKSLQTLQGRIGFQNLHVVAGDFPISYGSGRIEIRDGVILPSSFIECTALGIDVKGYPKGPLLELAATLDLSGHLEEGLFYFLPTWKWRQDIAYPFSAHIEFQQKGRDLSLEGSLSLVNEGECHFSIQKEKSSYEGEISGKDICLRQWPLEESLCSFVGKGSFSLQFEKEKFFLSLLGRDWAFSSPSVHLSITSLEKPVEVFWDKQLQFWEISTGPFQGKISHITSSLESSISINKLLWKKDSFFCEGRLYGPAMDGKGKMFCEMAQDFTIPKVMIEMESFEGNFESIKKIFSRLPKDIRGSFSGKGTFLYDKVWNFDGDMAVKDVSFSLNPYFHISQFQSILSIRSLENLWECLGTKGVLECLLGQKKESYSFSAPLCSRNKALWNFDVRVNHQTCDIIRLYGQAKCKNRRVEVNFDAQKTVLFGEKPKIHSCVLSTDWDWKSLEVDFSLPGSVLTSQGKSIVSLIFPGMNVPSISGTFHQHIFLSKERHLQFESKAQDFTVGGVHHDTFEVRGRIQKEKIEFSQIALDEYQSSFALFREPEIWKIPQFTLYKKGKPIVLLEGIFRKLQLELHVLQSHFSLQELKLCQDRNVRGFIEGQGCLFFDAVQSTLEVDLDATLGSLFWGTREIKSEDPVHLHFSSNEGWMLKGFHINFLYENFLIHCRCDVAKYDAVDKRFFCKNLHVQSPFGAALRALENEKGKRNMPLGELSHFLQNLLAFEGDLDMVGDLSLGGNGTEMEFISQETSVKALGKDRLLKHVIFSYNDRGLLLDFWYFDGNNQYKIANEVQWLLGLNGKLSLFENGKVDPLTIFWDWKKEQGWQIEKVRGSFMGLSCQLDSTASVPISELTGEIKVDFSVAKELFSEKFKHICEKFSFGEGFILKGKLGVQGTTPCSFQGVVSGKECEAFGSVFQTFFSKWKWNGSTIEISDVKLSDRSGIFYVPQIIMEKGGQFSIPSAEIRNFRPSLVRKKGAKESEIKPLVVREWKFSDIRGNVFDYSSIQGKCGLRFINSFKRSYSVLDVPSDVLSRIVGLDLELLIPVQGIIESDIHDGKFFISRIKDVYSEGKRSKFFLIEGASVDFQGNMDIHIKMKQYVLFKFTENFILSLKGKLGHPDIHLTKKRHFFARLFHYGSSEDTKEIVSH